MSTTNQHVIETTEATFERDVIQRSMDVPVVVDFWAAWCGPCRRLGPILEKEAEERAGKIVLVKVDTDAHPGAAAAFGVRSLPTVFAIKDGQVVDGFMGALPAEEVRAFIDRIMPTPVEQLALEARALEATDASTAEAKYRAALELAPNDEKALTGLARVLVARGKFEEAEEILAHLERRGPLNPEAERIKSRLVLKEGAVEAGDVAECRALVAANPKDLQARFKLAEALAAANQNQEALELCLSLVEDDRRGVGEEARKLMLAIFALLPEDSELVSEYRRRLSLVL
jgi:putative thioredoxin